MAALRCTAAQGGRAMSGSRIRPYLGPLIALLIVLAMGVGTVYAAIPNGSGTYYACLTKSSGVVRLINYPKVKCAKDERFIKWSQQGPQGPVGPQGAQGVQGAQGPAGPADWNAIPNKPAGFADGVDDDGVTAVKIRTVVSTTPAIINPCYEDWDMVDCPAGFLAVGGGWTVTEGSFNDLHVVSSRAWDADTWFVRGIKPCSAQSLAGIAAQVTCLRAEPAGLVIAAKNSNYGSKKAHVSKPKRP
jgi:hypothetical protein